MIYWIDHLSAILVAGAVMLISAAAFVMLGTGAREEVQLHAGGAFRESFVSQIETDFENLGAGLLANETAVLSRDSAHVRFRSVKDQGGTPAVIEYRRVDAGVEDGVQLYRIDRYADGVRTGGSNGRLVTFDLTFRDASGAEVPATSLGVRAVDVWMQWRLGLGGSRSRDIKDASWGSTIHPAPLRYL
jgi:hypothetical protein